MQLEMSERKQNAHFMTALSELYLPMLDVVMIDFLTQAFWSR